MNTYLYILSADRPFSETDVNAVKDAVCRMFECTEVSVAEGRVFTVHSALGPEEIERLTTEVWAKFRLAFKAGGRIQ